MKTKAMLKYIFLAIGIAVLAGAFMLYTNTQSFVNNSLTANGKVIELLRSRSKDSTTYRPVVTFTTQDGTLIEFTSSSSSNPPSYSRGETVEVLYQNLSPEKAKINSFFSLWGGSVIVGIFGFILFLIGFLTIFFGIIKAKKINDLKRNGFPISTTLNSVELNSSLTINGQSPYRICTQWLNPTTSELHFFYSENLWFNPTNYINDDELTVLIEKDNPKKYYVDTSFLPTIAS